MDIVIHIRFWMKRPSYQNINCWALRIWPRSALRGAIFSIGPHTISTVRSSQFSSVQIDFFYTFLNSPFQFLLSRNPRGEFLSAKRHIFSLSWSKSSIWVSAKSAGWPKVPPHLLYWKYTNFLRWEQWNSRWHIPGKSKPNAKPFKNSS
jgi:hypothetical protein